MKYRVRKIPLIFGIHADPPTWLQWVLGALPFVICILAYVYFSEARHALNPDDKLLPPMQAMMDAFDRIAFTKDVRSEQYLFGQDTLSSLKLLGMGVSVAAVLGMLIGLNTGSFPGLGYLLMPFITFVSIVPPLAILPILFVVFGVDDLAKVVLIVIGITPVIIRDIHTTVSKFPDELKTKALTLGANHLQVVYSVYHPQLMPRLIECVQLQLGSAWLFLIASEAISAMSGLGYRIYLVRRYMSMDIIIPYVIWITLLGVLFNFTLKALIKKGYPWYKSER